MKTRSASLLLGVLFAAFAAWPSAASAGTKDEALAGIKTRYPALVQLLAAHKVGETCQGLVEAVKADYAGEKVKVGDKTITIAQFIQAENADRTTYFQAAGKENNTTPEVVAKNFAQRRFALLKAGEYWKREDGSWVQKK